MVKYAAESGGADTFAVADLCPKCLLFLIEDSLSASSVDVRQRLTSSWATKSKPVAFREELR